MEEIGSLDGSFSVKYLATLPIVSSAFCIKVPKEQFADNKRNLKKIEFVYLLLFINLNNRIFSISFFKNIHTVALLYYSP